MCRSYQIGRIEYGRVKHYHCVVTQEAREHAAGRHFGTTKQLAAAREKYAQAVVNLLTSEQSQLGCEHCAQASDGRASRHGDDPPGLIGDLVRFAAD